ncbi:bacillithiol system redox-active protein YtxJ [Aureibaculum algae]|uniref:Bacillithiol system redox-active protein YtxJ n=1 Tax=Aureibaculum algae TaxID=2584122 RepID=A0A5B7TTG8_9FLAO|nr:bacillithiol system redox-active protein YtxJ [Aureibaculum algae]QCX38484.1 bacillithiol system redox-active protein YtxJ [Aureibaculum algae]
MGILKSLFGSSEASKPKNNLNWIALNSIEQLDEIEQKSNSKYQAIFKHSTRCGISSGVLRQFERQEDTGEVDFYLLDLLSFRQISEEITSKFGVMHQSPQLIVLKDGAVVAHGSHYDIMSVKI